MKKILIIHILILANLNPYAQNNDSTLLDKASTFSLFDRGDNSIDLKFIDPSKGSFGIDYKLAFRTKIGSLGKSDFKNLDFSLGSKGFVTVAGDENQNNSIINELKFEAFPLFRIAAKKITPFDDWRNYINDPDFDPINDPLIIKSQELAQKVSSPFWLFLNIHGKHETTQDFKNYDFAFGSQLSFSTSYLNAILDFPFGLLRVGKNNNPRQLDISIGYDYVTGMNKTELATLLDNSDFVNRLNIKAEWETGIFTSRDRLVILFDSYHNLRATQQLKNAGKDWNTFFMAKIEHLLSENLKTRTRSKVSIKYTNGELPPNFNQGYVFGGGFSVEF